MPCNPVKLLILDLDETLIYATEQKLPAVREDFISGSYFVYKRPFLDAFLREASEHYIIGIWSTADDDYVSAISALIRPSTVEFKIVWGRGKCSMKKDHNFDRYYFEKRLHKLKRKGFSLDHILIIDDTPEKAACNYGNAIYIKPFEGNQQDNELPRLLQYLLTLKDAPSIRSIEKRHWDKT